MEFIQKLIHQKISLIAKILAILFVLMVGTQFLQPMTASFGAQVQWGEVYTGKGLEYHVQFYSFAMGDGTPYMALQNGFLGQRLEVKKYANGEWVNVGTQNISVHPAFSTSLRYSLGLPYVCYTDVPRKPEADEAEATMNVKQYDGKKWIDLGSKALNEMIYVENTSEINQFEVDNGVPFVMGNAIDTNLTVDKRAPNGYAVLAYKNGSWKQLGDVIQRYCKEARMCVYNGEPYVFYQYLGKGYVVKFNGKSWAPVGNQAFPCEDQNGIRIQVEKGTPYISYFGAGGALVVMKLSGGKWISVNSDNSITKAFCSSLAVYNGKPYVSVVPDMNLTNHPDAVLTLIVYTIDKGVWTKLYSKAYTVGSKDDSIMQKPYLVMSNGRLYLCHEQFSGISIGQIKVKKYTIEALKETVPPAKPFVNKTSDTTGYTGIDNTPPKAPVVKPFLIGDKVIEGRGEKGCTVVIESNGKVIAASPTSPSDGSFKISLANAAAKDQNFFIYIVDAAGNKSPVERKKPA